MRNASTRRTSIATLALTLLTACGGNGGTNPGDDNEEFGATLTPGAIVGATITSSATGGAAIEYDETNLEYLVSLVNMQNVTQAHIHGPAGTGQNADVLVTLYLSDVAAPLVNGTLASGSVPPGSPLLSPGITLERVLALMRADSAFVMVHSTAYPDGEIRGHVIP